MKYFILFVFLLTLSLNLFSKVEKTNFDKDYKFTKPEVLQNKNSDIDVILSKDLPLESKPGLPVLPVKPVKLLVPFGYKAKGVEVIAKKPSKMKGFYKIQLGQAIIPYSFNRKEYKDYKKFFKVKNNTSKIYNSNRNFNAEKFSDFSIQKMRGYSIACFNLHPVSYIPVKGEIYYYDNMKVRLKLVKAKKQDLMFRNNPQDYKKVQSFVDNKDELNSYPNTIKSKAIAKYIIISTKNLLSLNGNYTFKTFAEFLTKKQGISVKLVSYEEILSKYSGIDGQEKIRNFIRFAYKNYGTEYVLLGGDADSSGEGKVIPIRRLFAEFSWDGKHFAEDIAGDVYYSCLDGTFNYDKDSHYGEIGDGENGGEVDLLAEVYVGRAPVSNAEQVSNFVRKTIAAYEYTDKKVLFVGENLFPGIWGKYYMSEIKDGATMHGFTTVGYDKSWKKETMFDKDSKWRANDLINMINKGFTVINHIGHCNATYAMKLMSYYLTRLNNRHFCFIYSQGCHAGEFTARDCLFERLMNGKYGTFAIIANETYGLGPEDPDPDSSVVTRGASQYFHRQFTDAMFNEGIKRLGKLNQDSKEDNISWMSHGTTRWVFWELNLMGDPYYPLNK